MTEQIPNQEIKPANILTKLYRQVLRKLSVDPTKFGSLTDQWISENTQPRSRDEEATIRNNLTKDLMSDQMSVAAFVKGLKLLRLTKCTIKIVVTDADGKEVDIQEALIPKE